MVAVNNGSLLVQTIFYIMNQSLIQEDTSYNYYYMQIGKETNVTKCYGIYGCFKLSAPWTSENRPVSVFPGELKQIEPRYWLHTRKTGSKSTTFNLNDIDYIENSGMDPMKPIYLITHGYMEGGKIGWIQRMTGELLNAEDCNVIVVDWQGGSSPPYTQAVANIRLIGVITAHLLNDIAQYTEDLKLDHVHCIGHSLGAHMSGYVGYTLKTEFNLTIGRITGLDPAEPHFAKAQPPVRLDRTAAQYVDIIHTDASQFIRGGLGMTETIGHVDYYPNGGSNQPGCSRGIVQFIKDEKGSFFNGMKKYLGCNHVRSHQIFLESINPRCTFLTISCPSFEDFISGKCWDCGKKGENCIRFGYHGRKHYQKLHGNKMKHKSLVQYLLTGDKEPYCRGHYRVTVQVSDSDMSRLHGGEIGQLMFVMHSTSDRSGTKTRPVGFVSGFYHPGAIFTGVVATDELKNLKAVEVEWRYNSSLFNPLTWRVLNTPKIYLKKVTVESLELQQRITVCPKHEENSPFVNGVSQMMINSYC